MADLIEFLRARLDEDERIARDAARESRNDQWSSSPYGDSVYADDTGRPILCGPYDYLADELKTYITRWHPKRMRDEVEAKREILDLHMPQRPVYDEDAARLICRTCGVADGWHDTPAPCDTLKLLAQPYAVHPDYDPEWMVSSDERRISG